MTRPQHAENLNIRTKGLVVFLFTFVPGILSFYLVKRTPRIRGQGLGLGVLEFSANRFEQIDSDRTGSGRFGSVRTGSGRTGSVRNGPGRFGSVRTAGPNQGLGLGLDLGFGSWCWVLV